YPDNKPILHVVTTIRTFKSLESIFTRKTVPITWNWLPMGTMFCLKVQRLSEHTKSVAVELPLLLLAGPLQTQGSKTTRSSTSRVTGGFVKKDRRKSASLKNSPNRQRERTSAKASQRPIPCCNWSRRP